MNSNPSSPETIPSSTRPITIPQRPSIRTILLLVNLGILLLPIFGIGVLRLYENELIRQTESELIGQGAIVRALYRQEFREALAEISAETGVPESLLIQDMSQALDASVAAAVHENTFLDPIVPQLSLPSFDLWRERVNESSVLPRPPEPAIITTAVDPIFEKIGNLLTPILKESQRVTLASIRVCDHQGIIIASTREQVGRSLLGQEEVVRALRGFNVSVLRQRISDDIAPPLTSLSRGTRVRVYVSMPVIENERVVGAILLSRSPVPVDKALFLNRKVLLILLAALLAIVLGVTVVVSLTITQPIHALVELSEQIMRGREARALERPFTREVSRLSEALVQMARTLQDRGEYIRTFARHVSHEFKTPLTSMKGALELLQDHLTEMSESEQRHFLGNLEKDTQRLQRLVQRLLELAKAELSPSPDGSVRSGVQGAMESGSQHCSLQTCLASLKANSEQLPAEIDWEVPEALPGIAIPLEALESVLIHLLENARNHAPGARVWVSAKVCSAAHSQELQANGYRRLAGGNGILVCIRDDGPGISSANQARLFEPFFTTARETGGTGMGLPIVQALLEAHGGGVRSVTTEKGACFELWLPSVETGPASR